MTLSAWLYVFWVSFRSWSQLYRWLCRFYLFNVEHQWYTSFYLLSRRRMTVMPISPASLRWSSRDLWLSRHWLYPPSMTYSSRFPLASRHDSSSNLPLWLRYGGVKLVTASLMLRVLPLGMFMVAEIELTRAHNLLSLRIGQNVNTLWNNPIQVCIAYFNTFHSLFFPLLYPLILSKSYFFSSFILALRWYFRLRW